MTVTLRQLDGLSFGYPHLGYDPSRLKECAVQLSIVQTGNCNSRKLLNVPSGTGPFEGASLPEAGLCRMPERAFSLVAPGLWKVISGEVCSLTPSQYLGMW